MKFMYIIRMFYMMFSDAEKFLGFVLLSVSVLRDSGSRKYQIRLKFDASVYVLCEISDIVFGVHY